MITKDNKLNTEEHVHDCNCEGGDCNCDGGDCDCGNDADIITLDMEDGSKKDFMVLDILQEEGQNYIALSEVGAMEYDILRFEEQDDNLELSIIEDDDEYNRIAEIFNERFSSMDTDEEMEAE
ncbi:MAG: DUF1292 domain-containing protein [Candidatus Cloacimonetes bacterium]|jgi:uncharacterized protein YrzB (UPF0473 family)|nr:DUF1292 domain-containing protein [Candidatus Cloacimonadota bacterium]MDD2507327.1 DUF1292 domain-containing protein [Candidatus Cloacimonadota bacterium]MDD4147443.1 DUF1292 domain-containing protein [Candidatus Cloacimonadota bacterium]MDD4560754.1 DUF1292 domain-containing protein [Candidatus Cloacimonadota bacterium]